MSNLSIEEIYEIYDSVYLHKLSYNQVATRFRISDVLVGKIVGNFKADADYIEKLKAKQEVKR